VKWCVQMVMATRNGIAETDRCRGWLVLQERCAACGWEQVAVAPLSVPLTNLECSRCHAMACVAKVVPR
jgi:hypothetical protein